MVVLVVFLWWMEFRANNAYTIDFITIATAGDAVDFGDLNNTQSRNQMELASKQRYLQGGEAPSM